MIDDAINIRGPAGLTAAYFLQLMGHQTTVYEQKPHLPAQKNRTKSKARSQKASGY